MWVPGPERAPRELWVPFLNAAIPSAYWSPRQGEVGQLHTFSGQGTSFGDPAPSPAPQHLCPGGRGGVAPQFGPPHPTHVRGWRVVTVQEKGEGQTLRAWPLSLQVRGRPGGGGEQTDLAGPFFTLYTKHFNWVPTACRVPPST